MYMDYYIANRWEVHNALTFMIDILQSHKLQNHICV
jgi:hypothetical protein